MSKVQETIKSHNNTHGTYIEQAELAEQLQMAIQDAKNWDDLSPGQAQALDMIFIKISRIMTGDHNFGDHWHDIAGYAMLVEELL